MARSQNPKRELAEETSRAHVDPPAKKIKTRSEAELEAWESWEYPSEFYDRLAKVHLSRRALKEFDRRTRTRPSPPASPIKHALLRTVASQELARFARHGGPDLRHLRGCPYPTIDNRHPVATSASQKTKSTDPPSTFPTPATTTTTTKSTPFNRDFDLHLADHGIHPMWKSQELDSEDLDEITATLAVPRPSLSPSNFSDGAFKAFRERSSRAEDEADVWANVIPAILGPSQTSRFCARNMVFTNLEPLTDGTIPEPKPDISFGAYPEQLARSIRNELAGHIIPSTMLDKPIAPNFFLEVKGPEELGIGVEGQARYDGAVGSRAMHSLHNYGAVEPEYDGKARTFSATYYAGVLTLYAHHVTAPTTEGGRPEYHMNMILGFAMRNSRDTFVEGAGALRNMLDLADQHRGDFIRAANIRASQAIASQERTTAKIQPPRDSSN